MIVTLHASKLTWLENGLCSHRQTCQLKCLLSDILFTSLTRSFFNQQWFKLFVCLMETKTVMRFYVKWKVFSMEDNTVFTEFSALGARKIEKWHYHFYPVICAPSGTRRNYFHFFLFIDSENILIFCLSLKDKGKMNKKNIQKNHPKWSWQSSWFFFWSQKRGEGRKIQRIR